MPYSGRVNARATDLFADLIIAGKIPGITQADLMDMCHRDQSGTLAPFVLPVTYCARCRGQLVAYWYAIDPLKPGPCELICLFCARDAQSVGETVWALTTEDPR